MPGIAPRVCWESICLNSSLPARWKKHPGKALSGQGKPGCWEIPPAPGLLLYEHRFCFDWIGAPLITRDMTYVHTKQYRPIRVYNSVDPRLILEDFYCKLSLFAEKERTGK